MRFRMIRGKKKKKQLIRKKRRLKNITKLRSKDYDMGYDTGYNSGYNAAVQLVERDQYRDYDEGFDKGLYAGGEEYIDELLPGDVILPEITIQQVIGAGLDQMQHHYHRLLSSQEVVEKIIAALDTQSPLSIIRLGDGELLTLAQELVLSIDEVKRKGVFLNYAGVEIPDLAARDQLAQSIRQAGMVGIPKLRMPNFLPLMIPVLQAHGINYKQLSLTYSTINYVLYTDGHLAKLLSGRRILVIGNQAQALSELLANYGIQVTEPATQVHGIKDVPRVMSEVAHRDFDIALVSAGIPAVVIAERIATELGKVAIDFGHLANSMITGEAPWK